MTTPLDAALTQFAAGVSANTAPPPDLLHAGPATDAVANAAADNLQGTDTVNAGKIGDVPGSQDGTQVATMIPGLLGAMVGAAGGALGSAVSALERIPSSMMGAIGPAMSALTAATTAADPVSAADTTIGSTGYDPGVPTGGGGGPVGATTPAAGPPLPKAVLPVTGGSPTPVGVPPGGATPQQTSGGGAGFAPMPMGMPMGGGMGTAGTTGAPESRAKKVATPRQPHTEPVAGKIAEERIAVPTKPRDEGPIVRRITIPEAKE